MTDIQILRELINDGACHEVASHYGKKNKIVIEENDQHSYQVSITNTPSHDEIIVIKADCFYEPINFFANSKHECRRADAIIITNFDKHRKIICVELKMGKAKRVEVISQLKGAKCLVSYIQEIGKQFWGSPDFLDDYEFRFVSIRQIGINKKTTRSKKSKKDIHDSPEKMLTINSPHNLNLRQLL